MIGVSGEGAPTAQGQVPGAHAQKRGGSPAASEALRSMAQKDQEAGALAPAGGTVRLSRAPLGRGTERPLTVRDLRTGQRAPLGPEVPAADNARTIR